MVNLQCHAYSRTLRSSAVLYLDDCMNRTNELLGDTERTTTLLPEEVYSDISMADPLEDGSKFTIKSYTKLRTGHHCTIPHSKK